MIGFWLLLLTFGGFCWLFVASVGIWRLVLAFRGLPDQSASVVGTVLLQVASLLVLEICKDLGSLVFLRVAVNIRRGS